MAWLFFFPLPVSFREAQRVKLAVSQMDPNLTSVCVYIFPPPFVLVPNGTQDLENIAACIFS